jgi:hypothetical protein
MKVLLPERAVDIRSAHKEEEKTTKMMPKATTQGKE